eukprot:403354831
MESYQTLYSDELKDLDKFENDIQIMDINFEQIFSKKQKKELQKSLTYGEKRKIDWWSFRWLLPYIFWQQKGIKLEQTYLIKQLLHRRFETIRIIKLLRYYLKNLNIKALSENAQQNSVLKNLPQNYNLWSPDHNKLIDQNSAKNLALSKNKSSIRQNNKLQNFKEQKENKDKSFSNSLPSQFANLLQEVDEEIIQRIISQVELMLPTSILQSREETKSGLQLVQQFGPCIKKAFWVFENNSYQKARKSQINGRDPVFFTKQPNQDVQFGFKILNHQVIDKLKIVDLKEFQVNFPHTDFVQIEGECFWHLSIGINKQIDNSYKNFLDFQKDQSTSFYFNKDAYRVEFSDNMQEMFEIININTNQGRLLKRFEAIQEPTISIKINNEIKWKVRKMLNIFTYKNYFFDSFYYGKVDSQQQLIISQEIPKIIKIEKIFNKPLYDRFINEIKFMSQKYPGKDFEDIMQHLFHGTRNVDPSLIFDSFIGFDFRLSNDKCFFGRGAYFAKNSGYSYSYRHSIPNSTNQYQISFALVITGESITFDQNQPDLKAPPYKPGSNIQRYDSVHNRQLDHYIVYDHYRAYILAISSLMTLYDNVLKFKYPYI